MGLTRLYVDTVHIHVEALKNDSVRWVHAKDEGDVARGIAERNPLPHELYIPRRDAASPLIVDDLERLCSLTIGEARAQPKWSTWRLWRTDAEDINARRPDSGVNPAHRYRSDLDLRPRCSKIQRTKREALLAALWRRHEALHRLLRDVSPRDQIVAAGAQQRDGVYLMALRALERWIDMFVGANG